MSVDEIITIAGKSLPRVEQNRVIDAIYEQRASEQQLTPEQLQWVKSLQDVSEIPIWSPYDSVEAAAELYRLGEEARKNQ